MILYPKVKCSNSCNKWAHKEVLITKQKICQACWEEENYFDTLEALKVFAAITLFDYKIITTTYMDKPDGEVWFWLSSNPDEQKTFDFEDINWNTLGMLHLLPNVQRTKIKLIEKVFSFSTSYSSSRKDQSVVWDASVRLKIGTKYTSYGSTEEEALFRAVYFFYSNKEVDSFQPAEKSSKERCLNCDGSGYSMASPEGYPNGVVCLVCGGSGKSL